MRRYLVENTIWRTVSLGAALILGLAVLSLGETEAGPRGAPPDPLPRAGTELASAPEVDVELVLAVDISQSMDKEEQKIQREGYVSAILSPQFLQAVKLGPIGRIAVTYIEWGGKGEHFTVANWQMIEDAADARAFAAKIAEAPLRKVQRTSISSALVHASLAMEVNGFQGLRKVIDISGDGPNNQGELVTASRDAVLASGVTINGLPLMLKKRSIGWYHLPNLDHYYQDCVIGGPGAFAIPVKSLEGFADAIRMKLVMEIAGLTPNPPGVMPAVGRELVPCNIFE
ncbi:MAG: DUF1194 domain-containing protein [Pseudomonadota bacterium]